VPEVASSSSPPRVPHLCGPSFPPRSQFSHRLELPAPLFLLQATVEPVTSLLHCSPLKFLCRRPDLTLLLSPRRLPSFHSRSTASRAASVAAGVPPPLTDYGECLRRCSCDFEMESPPPPHLLATPGCPPCRRRSRHGRATALWSPWP
jgi:hypothetical protein